MSDFFIFAGELSGDTFGALLIRELRKSVENLKITGVAGPEMRNEGVTGFLNMEHFEVMGFSDVFRSLPRLRYQFYQIRDYLLENVPRVAIFIDSPGMSIRMARSLRKKGYKGKIVQYICPTVWAWGKQRIKQMAEVFDLLLTIFPFEKEYFKETSLKVDYVGNPLKEQILQHHYEENWAKLIGIKNTQNLIALFPGSRPAEIQRNLPKLLEAAKRIKNEYPKASLAISCAKDSHIPLMQELISKQGFIFNKELFLVPRIYTYELMKLARSALAKSGTITLELAFHRCPTVVVYELTRLNRLIAKYLLRLRLPHYCIVNILTNKRVFPELIEKEFTAEAAHLQLRKLHEKGEYREACIAHCQEIEAIFQEKNASQNAAAAIVALLS